MNNVIQFPTIKQINESPTGQSIEDMLDRLHMDIRMSRRKAHIKKYLNILENLPSYPLHMFCINNNIHVSDYEFMCQELDKKDKDKK